MHAGPESSKNSQVVSLKGLKGYALVKAADRTLMILTPGTVLALVYPESVKSTVSFYAFGITLMKLTPGVNFINVKRARFSYERLFSSYVLA